MWQITEEQSGQTLLEFLYKQCNGRYSKKQIKRFIENNTVLIDGIPERFASTRVFTGNQLLFNPKETKQPLIPLLYEDSDYYVVNKPSGITAEWSLFPNYWMVHRLDKETTGVWLWAKTKEAFNHMTKLFKERKVRKHYHAIVDGVLKQKKGRIDNYLAPLKKFEGQTIWGESKIAGAKRAITEWHLENQLEAKALVSCFPETGRTHQIRVHMASVGHPILGDFQYGRHFICQDRPNRSLLHASSLSWDDINVEAPLPEDMILSGSMDLFTRLGMT